MAEEVRKVTPTEKARRSDSLYFDNVKRRSLCDLIANLEAERDELRGLAFRLYECSQHSSCAFCKRLDETCDFPRDMRALGIDVVGKQKGTA